MMTICNTHTAISNMYCAPEGLALLDVDALDGGVGQLPVHARPQRHVLSGVAAWTRDT